MVRYLPTVALFVAYQALGWAQTSRVDGLKNAAAALERHDLASAEQVLESLLRNAPGDAVALNLLGVVRAQEGKPTEAERLFQRAIQTGHRIVGPHLNLARLYRADRPLDAIHQVKEALEISPGDPQARTLLHETARESILAARKIGDQAGALALAHASRAAAPHDPEILYECGMVAVDSELLDEARIAFEETLRIQPQNYDAMYALARADLDESRAQQAEELMRRYLAAKPGDATAQYGLGYVLVAEQKLDDAANAFRRSLELQPDQTESVFQLGEIALDRGDRQSAADSFQKVLERDPHHAGALTDLGEIAYRANEFEKAQQYLDDAVTAYPRYQKAHYYLALTLRKLGRPSDSEQEFERARSLQKAHASPAIAEAPPR